MFQWFQSSRSYKLKNFVRDEILPKRCFWFNLFDKVKQAHLGQLRELEFTFMFGTKKVRKWLCTLRNFRCQFWANFHKKSVEFISNLFWVTKNTPFVTEKIWNLAPLSLFCTRNFSYQLPRLLEIRSALVSSKVSEQMCAFLDVL